MGQPRSICRLARHLFLYLLILGPAWLWAQTPQVLAPDAFLAWVGAYHPLAQQANLQPDRAEANLRSARGAFDPKLYGTLDQKQFKGDEYFNYLDGGVKLPTRLGGLEIKGGYERAAGIYVNPDRTVPVDGLVYAGISMPLLQGLMIDARRAALQQAKIYTQAAEADRQAMLNDLYFEAMKAYWDWSEAYANVQVLDRAAVVARERFELVRTSFLFGDEPAVDTLEAHIQWQTRLLDYETAKLDFAKASLALAVYLWDENGQAVELRPETVPVDVTQTADQAVPAGDSLLILMNQLPDRHPLLLQYRYQLATLDVERRLKAEKLKPKLNVNYNLLQTAATPIGEGEFFHPGLFANNFKWGVSLGFPIFLREARGDLELTRIKQRETGFKQDLKRQELANKIQAYVTEMENLAGQIDLSRFNVVQYEALFEAEIIKFRAGESSIFLINSRENKLIEARLKLQSLQAKYGKATAGLTWSAGAWDFEP